MKGKSAAEPADERETTDRLLDTAERLFGEHGFDGVGMRALAEEAKVNLGATTYHYGSKEALYIETFMRRFRPANAERLRLLREARASAGGRPLPVETIVDCMVRPPYRLGLAHPDFHALLARNLFMPPPFMQEAMHREMGPNIEVFVEALHESLPDLPEDLMGLRVMFAMGSLTMFTVHVGRMKRARPPGLDESVIKELVRFISGGLESAPATAAGDRLPFPRTPKRPTSRP